MTAKSGPGRPRTDDAAILEGARDALIRNPRASMAEIGRTAGVGMSALYLRFPDRLALLRRIAADANDIYEQALTAAEAELASAGARPALVRFMTDVADSSVHRLLLAIAGTFERTQVDIAESTRLRDRGRRLVSRLHADDALRPGVSWEDLGKALEAVSALEGSDPERSHALRIRMLDIVLTGLTAGVEPLRGEAPLAQDFAENR